MAFEAVDVTIHRSLMSSPSLDLLAEQCGYANRFEALGRLTMLYARLTTLAADGDLDLDDCRPSRGVIVQSLGVKGPDALLLCDDLAESTSGGVRIKGARRLWWWSDLRSRSSNGGKARAATAARDERGRMVGSTTPAGPSQATSVSPASSSITSDAGPAHPAGDQDQGSGIRDQIPEIPDLAPAGARDLRAPVADRLVSLNWSAWRYGYERMATAREEMASDRTPPWPPLPSGLARDELSARLRELLAETTPEDYEHAFSRVRQRIDIAEAECRRDRTLRWLAPTKVFDRKQFWTALSEHTPESVRARRPAARTSAFDQQMQRVTDLEDAERKAGGS